MLTRCLDDVMQHLYYYVNSNCMQNIFSESLLQKQLIYNHHRRLYVFIFVVYCIYSARGGFAPSPAINNAGGK